MTPDSWITFFCEEHDLAIPLDARELNELRALPVDARGKALFNLQDRQRRRVQWNLKLELEKSSPITARPPEVTVQAIVPP